MKQDQLHELLCQAVETEKGGVAVYETAIGLAQNGDLRKEWEEYLQQTRQHVEVVTAACTKLGLDPETDTPGRKVVRLFSKALIEAMEEAADAGDPAGAELVAAECVTHAEMKDHLNWELIGEAAKELKGAQAEALDEAYREVEDQEDEHFYHTKGWTRELWLKALGVPAVLPPPEEKRKVKSEAEAARARETRAEMLDASAAKGSSRQGSSRGSSKAPSKGSSKTSSRRRSKSSSTRA